MACNDYRSIELKCFEIEKTEPKAENVNWKARCNYPKCPGNNTRKLKRCSICNAASYCNQECQRNDWPDHKLQCETPSELRGQEEITNKFLFKSAATDEFIEEMRNMWTKNKKRFDSWFIIYATDFTVVHSEIMTPPPTRRGFLKYAAKVKKFVPQEFMSGKFEYKNFHDQIKENAAVKDFTFKIPIMLFFPVRGKGRTFIYETNERFFER